MRAEYAIVLTALSLASRSMGAMAPRASSTLAVCFACQLLMPLGGTTLSAASSTTDSTTGDLVCQYNSDMPAVCSYSPYTGESTGTDEDCPPSAAALAFTCPDLASSRVLAAYTTDRAFYSGDFICQYSSGAICQYNPTTGTIQPNSYSAAACPAVAPQCTISAEPPARHRRHGVYRREDNFTAVKRKTGAHFQVMRRK